MVVVVALVRKDVSMAMCLQSLMLFVTKISTPAEYAQGILTSKIFCAMVTTALQDVVTSCYSHVHNMRYKKYREISILFFVSYK